MDGGGRERESGGIKEERERQLRKYSCLVVSA
jgi:hypothetical protein